MLQMFQKIWHSKNFRNASHFTLQEETGRIYKSWGLSMAASLLRTYSADCFSEVLLAQIAQDVADDYRVNGATTQNIQIAALLSSLDRLPGAAQEAMMNLQKEQTHVV